MKKATTEDEVLDRIDSWHMNPLTFAVSLPEHLGWTDKEYKAWVEDGELPSS